MTNPMRVTTALLIVAGFFTVLNNEAGNYGIAALFAAGFILLTVILLTQFNVLERKQSRNKQ